MALSQKDRLAQARARHERALALLTIADQRARVAQARLDFAKAREQRTRRQRQILEAAQVAGVPHAAPAEEAAP